MKSITIKLKDSKNTEALAEMLKALNFVESVEVYEDEDKLSGEEISMVEERWEEYKRNPGSGVSWKEVKSKIKKKHGL